MGGKRVVTSTDTLTVDQVCEADDLIVAYKHEGKVYHLVGVYTNDGYVRYGFHPFAAQDNPEFLYNYCDDSVSAAVKVRELMAFDDVEDFLDWILE